jgi:hypothetical protein
MKRYFAPFALGIAAALSACASQPGILPNVTDRQLSPREISPGESIKVTFNLETPRPAAVKRIYVRGLPKNTLISGTRTELPLPNGPKTAYAARIEVRAPAADGQFNIEVVFETPGQNYVAPLGSLAIRDTPSRILHTQFLPGSHAAANCSLGTKLLEFEYAVEDDNGAADFVAATLFAKDAGSKDFVFFPHWGPVLGSSEKGIVLDVPTEDSVRKQLVTSDIRVRCKMPQATLYQFELKGQSVSRVTGKSTTAASDPARYYVQ